MGKWRGGPSKNIITIQQLPNGNAQAKFSVGKDKDGKIQFALMTGNFSTHRDIIRGTFFCAPAYPMQNERKQKFRMNLGGDRDSWEATLSTEDGGKETWSATRMPPDRKKGEKLNPSGLAFGSAERFESLVKAKDTSSWAEEQRAKLLEESKLQAATAPVDSEPPSVAVGDPYDEHALSRTQKGTKHYGYQMKTSVRVRAMDEDPTGVMRHMDDPFLDRSELARKLAKEQRAKVKVSDEIRSRGTFRPSSAAAYRDMATAPSLQETGVDGITGGKLFEAAHRRRMEEADERKARAKRAKDAVNGVPGAEKPPPFVSLVARKPLEYGRYPALTESGLVDLTGPGAGAGAAPGS